MHSLHYRLVSQSKPGLIDLLSETCLPITQDGYTDIVIDQMVLGVSVGIRISSLVFCYQSYMGDKDKLLVL